MGRERTEIAGTRAIARPAMCKDAWRSSSETALDRVENRVNIPVDFPTLRPSFFDLLRVGHRGVRMRSESLKGHSLGSRACATFCSRVRVRAERACCFFTRELNYRVLWLEFRQRPALWGTAGERRVFVRGIHGP